MAGSNCRKLWGRLCRQMILMTDARYANMTSDKVWTFDYSGGGSFFGGGTVGIISSYLDCGEMKDGVL